MAIIKREPINDLNFLRWYEAENFFLPSPDLPELEEDPLASDPFAYLRRSTGKNCTDYALPILYKDVIRFFINSKQPLLFADTADLRLGVLKGGELVSSNAGNITPTAGASVFRLFGSITIPPLPFGYYNLCVYREATMEVLLVSNVLRVASFDAWETETVFLEYKHKQDVASYEFSKIPGFWYLSTRLDARAIDEQNPANRAEYDDLNGFSRITRFELGREIQLQTDYLNPETHAAFSLMLGFSEKKIDGIAYHASGSYDREPVEGFNLSRAKVKLKDQDFRNKIKYC